MSWKTIFQQRDSIQLLMISCCLAITSFSQIPSAGEQIMQDVKGIEGKDHVGREEFVKGALKKLGVNFLAMPFDTILSGRNGKKDTLRGENIIVRMGNGKSRIVVGAHYDAVPGAPGANDNGGGVGVILELVAAFNNKPLHHTIDFCFFDREEDGLIGSAVYVQRHEPSVHHLAMINLDVEGTGDELYVGPVGGGDDNLIMRYVHAARDSTKFPYEENEIYPDADNESFAAAHMENISISVVVKGDVEKIVAWAKSGYPQFKNPEDVPVVLKVMHTPQDVSALMTPEALNMSYQFTKSIITLLDAGEP